MPDATIEIKGMDEAIKKLEDLGQLRKVHAGIRAAGMYIKGKIAKYPPRKHVSIASLGGWKSDKQRRWFFWALKEGKIDVPYRRGISPSSEALGRKWTSRYDRSKFEAVVGNNVSYARFVMGDKQTKMMKRIGWKSIETVATEETKRVQEYVFDAVRRAIGA
jgi:hypothetical protein